MTDDVLGLAIHMSSAAIGEALARRAQSDPYSPAAEVARLQQELAFGGDGARGLDPAGEAAALRTLLDERCEQAPRSPLALLRARLGLTRCERDVLTLLLAWSAEPRVGLLFGHVHDALQKTRPTVSALAEVLRDPLAVTLALGPGSALRRFGVALLEHAGPDASLGLDARVVHYLLSAALPPLVSAAGRLSALPMPGAIELAWTSELARVASAEVVLVRGQRGAGRHRFAAQLCAKERRTLLALHVDRADHEALPALLAAAVRDALMLDARLVVSGALDEASARTLSDVDGLGLVLAFEPSQALPQALLDRRLASVALQVPNGEQRVRLWADALGRDHDDAEVIAVAERYAFTPGVIRRAARQASSLGVEQAARIQLAHGLDSLAQCSTPGVGWDRLVVPPATREALTAICAQARQRVRVGEEWGFARHHALGQGVKALFFGRPGTGKTLAAEIVAAELDLPLYRIDLSRIVSKWIGETEQNLSRLFDEAEKSQAILFFDEADSLFAKRTAIATSTDRYANMEVNHLLQRVDAHPGIVILATNLKANLDDAFARRLHFVVELPEPDAAARERIWRLSVPPDAPLASDVDLGLLAQRFDIPGGAIKNAVVGAAYLAAAQGRAIEQRHFATALRREFAKLDRLYQRAELDALVGSESDAVA